MALEKAVYALNHNTIYGMLFAFSFSFTQYIVPAIILHMNISLNFLHVITPKQFNCYTQTCFSYVMIIFTASILPAAQEEPMNILFHRYGSICEPDIMEAFQSLNFTVIEEDLEISQKSIDGENGSVSLPKRS